jgi:hypothetical protein
MKFEVLATMKILMMIFWIVTPCGLVGRYQRVRETYYLYFSPEDGYSMFRRNVGIDLQVHTVLLPIRHHGVYVFSERNDTAIVELNV